MVLSSEGIERVEIVEVSNVAVLATNVEQNAVDLTVTCQGRSGRNFMCTTRTICNPLFHYL